MKSSAKKIELASVDDLFSTEEGRQDAKLEKIQEIPLSELHPFKNHPFKVKDDEAMMETADSIKQYGVLVPAIARPDPEGGYELVAGHRRHRASELADKETMPVIVRDLDDDAATIIMVDSNLQRESLLPSERAFAYKMKLDAMKHQGERVDLTSSQVGTKLRADEKVAKDSGESRNQVQRFVRLTNLVPELLAMVDEKKISFNPAVELSYLDEKQQQDFLEAMDASQNAPSLSQAIRIKKLAQQGEFDYDAVYNIMNAKLYEDVSKGLLPEKRFQMLADRYDKEQAELTEKIEQYEREGRAEHDQLDKIQDFIDEVSKYAGITELNYKILHQLIDKILVSRAEKVDGEYVQKIQIFYRFIGPLDAIE